MNTRSLSFRLVAWYASLLTGVFVLLGVIMYADLRFFLENNLRQTQARRRINSPIRCCLNREGGG